MADIVYPGSPAEGPLNAGAMPVNYDFTIYQGDTVEFTVTVKDSANAPVDLTGSTAQSVLKTGYADLTDTPFTCEIPDPPTGVVAISMSAVTTAGLNPGSTYIWDFQITYPGEVVRTYLTGDVTVVPEVTTT